VKVLRALLRVSLSKKLWTISDDAPRCWSCYNSKALRAFTPESELRPSNPIFLGNLRTKPWPQSSKMSKFKIGLAGGWNEIQIKGIPSQPQVCGGICTFTKMREFPCLSTRLKPMEVSLCGLVDMTYSILKPTKNWPITIHANWRVLIGNAWLDSLRMKSSSKPVKSKPREYSSKNLRTSGSN